MSALRDKVTRTGASKPYAHKKWKEARERAFRLWGHKCAQCHTEKKQLQVAHWGQRLDWDRPLELVPLCIACHNKHDAKDREITTAQLRELRKEIAGQLRLPFIPAFINVIEIQEGQDILPLVAHG